MFGEIAYFNSFGDFMKICNIFYKSKILSSCTFGGLKLAICRNTVSIKKLGRVCCCDVTRGTRIDCELVFYTRERVKIGFKLRYLPILRNFSFEF